MTFSICNDYSQFKAKDVFRVLPHDPDGKICYIETFISGDCNRDIIRQIESVIVKRFPQINKAVWCRPGDVEEREYHYRRRDYEASNGHKVLVR